MNAIEDRPSISERYSAATESSNLRVKEVRGDIDYIVAAGWGGTGIGPRLLRLRGEFDAIKGARDLANQAWLESERVAIVVDGAAAAASKDPELQTKLRRRVVNLREQAENAAATASAFIFVELGDNLYHVKAHLGELASIQATKTGFMENDAKAAYLAGKALEAWLDPNCTKCSGRGFNGGGRHEMSGAPIKCRSCRETGKRITSAGNSDAQRLFVGHILNLIEGAVADAETGMARRLYAKE
jgi:hypothetical protein